MHVKPCSYHKTCWNVFQTAYNNLERDLSKVNANKDGTYFSLHRSHEKAFETVLSHIESNVIESNNIVKLADLRLLYVNELSKTDHLNLKYRSQKLKRRLENHIISSKMQFSSIHYRRGDNYLWFIHKKSLTVSQALEEGYSLDKEDITSRTAMALKNKIHDSFEKMQEGPWPPTAEVLETDLQKFLPTELIQFLSLLITGNDNTTSEKYKQLVFSIRQDLSHAVTKGRWKMPKHILICMTIRHLYRSKTLTQILHRLGHC